MISDCHRCYK